MKKFASFVGVDAVAGTIMWLVEPNFLKVVLSVGLASLIAAFLLFRQGRISIYASQLVMALITAIHFA